VRPPQLLAAMPWPCVLIVPSKRIGALNPAAEALFGKGLVGRPYALLRHPGLIAALDRSLQDRQPRNVIYLRNDGFQDVSYTVSCRAILAENSDRIDGILLSFEDMTHKERAEQIRRDFVANVSHELRTPLTSLMGFIETLRGAAQDDATARMRFLNIMQSEADRMNRLVADLLSLSTVEREERVKPSQDVDLHALLSMVLRSLEPMAEAEHVVFETRFAPRRFTVKADADQLRQVFANLLENAIKYGGSGGRVEIVTASKVHDAAIRAPSVRVDVRDFGPGIGALHLPRLTERFYRADPSRSPTLGGTGLGLSIVKHILSRHRGQLKISSTEGQGATFTVILPCEDDASDEASA